MSLGIYMLSYLPVVGRFVLPAASFYTFNNTVGPIPATAIFGSGIFLPRRYLVVFLQSYFSSRSLMRELLEPYFSRIRFSKEQKRLWFRDREGLLFGFGVGFYIFLKIPLLGVLIYGIAEASTAYLITKITDPPPSPAYSEKFAESQSCLLILRPLYSTATLATSPGVLILDFSSNMGLNEIRTALKVDLKKPAAEQPGLHVNRSPILILSSCCLPITEQMASRRQVVPNWVNDMFVLRQGPVPFTGTVKNGEVVKIECVDWTGGQIGNNDSADDVKNVDLTKVHYLSGPFEVETAEPGDVLIVEIQDIQPFQDQPWGFTGVFDKSNGGGFLDDIYPHAAKAIWDFEGIFCSSRHIPHVRFAGLIHPGILGCAPSRPILEEWNRRESELIHTTQLERIVAQPPEPQNVHAGSATDEVKAMVGKEGARTIPGRPEHGGNCDIKNLSRGSKTFLPIHVKGAKFSVGDLHFSQGDGEISFCGAIEMAGIITVKLTVMKNGVVDLGMKSPIFLPGPVEPHFGPGRYLTFEGFSVDENGKQHYLDATVAYRQTTLRCIEYLRRFGYSDYQIYLMLSCAPIQGHIAGLVDIPNACTTLGLPMDIFDFDISPTAAVKKIDMGACAFAST
ncbi:MAG: hypothetical protein Q9179_003729 [Wetmoreana sp. 5 TL-2023]